MRLLLYPIIILLLLSVFGSCGRHDYDERLLRAESIIFDSPDSSLLILESISPDELNRESDRALYALLLTETLEKLHLNPTDDSLISIATDYYDNHTDVERQVRSHYYRGIVQYHNDRYSPAIVNYFQARDIAGKNDMYFWRGLACRGISDIYNKTYNAAEELNYAREEYEYTLKSGRQPYVNYALFDLARSLCNVNELEESNNILNKVLDSARFYNDHYLEYGAKQLMVTNLMLDSRVEEACPIIREIFETPFKERYDSFLLANLYIETGKFKNAEDILSHLSIRDNEEKLSVIGLKSEIMVARNDFKNAFIFRDSAFKLTNIEFRENTSNSLTTSLTEYFDIKDKHQDSLIQASRLKNWIILIIAVFLISVVVFVSFLLLIKQKRKIEEKVVFAEQLKSDIDRMKTESADAIKLIQKLMSTKYKLLENLSIIMMESTDTKAARRRIADSVTGIIEDLSIGSKSIQLLEDDANSVYNNILYDFRIDLPDLKEADYRLYVYSIFGLSNSVISLFLKEDKIEAVYNRRRRLKDKIKKLDEEKQLRYLKFL
ncbi:MAG: hypothetical protein K2K47_03600 [Duncaniella sp.]|nr:hypothetical protein [Duncaniella sp.]